MKLQQFAAGLFIGLGLSGSALAVTSYSWTINDSTDLTGPVTGTKNFSSNGDIVTAYGYATQNSNGSGLFSKQTVTVWDGGIGIKTSNVSNESSSPNHAADNDGRDELFVFDFNNADFIASGFQIGWNNGTSGDNRPDLRVWVGGGATGIDFSTVCFSGCDTTLDSLGFTSILFANVSANTAQSIMGNLAGRYLVVTAEYSVADGLNCTTRYGVTTCTPTYLYDYFKLNKITGTEREPPPGEVPEPASLSLLGLGLLGLVATRRRKQ